VVSTSLKGNGVILEPLRADHADALVAAAADGEIHRSEVTIVPDATSVNDYLSIALEGQRAGTMLPYAIVIAQSSAVVGSTRFWNIDLRNRSLEIGSTWIGKSHQGTFVNPAIKYLMLRYAFEVMNCVRVQFRTDVHNAHSRAAILRLGAKEEGVMRHERIMPGGRKRNSFLFSIIDPEWPEARARLEQRLRAFGFEPSFEANGVGRGA
jgi:RimJ/RimL family protein N-acetyltransferase